MTRVAILGAGGVGLAFYRLYADKFEHIDLYDRYGFDQQNTLVKPLSFPDYEMIDVICQGADFLINAMPVYNPEAHQHVLNACVQHGCSYLALTEDDLVTQAIETATGVWGDKLDMLVAPNCGVAPGLINMIATHMAGLFGKPMNLDMYVGGLTRNAVNPILYVPTRNLLGIAHKYIKPYSFITGGAMGRGEPVIDQDTQGADYQQVVIDETTYEAFPMGGSVGTLYQSLRQNHPNLRSACYRSLRYPGHLSAVKQRLGKSLLKPTSFKPSVFQDEATARKLQCMLDLMDPHRRHAADQYLLLHVQASGSETGWATVDEHTYAATHRFRPLRVVDRTLYPYEWMPAATLYAMIKAFKDEKIGPGFQRPENLDFITYLWYCSDSEAVGRAMAEFDYP